MIWTNFLNTAVISLANLVAFSFCHVLDRSLGSYDSVGANEMTFEIKLCLKRPGYLTLRPAKTIIIK